MINVLFFTSKSTYSGGKNKLTLKHNYNSISKAIQKQVKENEFTNSESRKFHRIDELGLRGSKRLGSQQSEKSENSKWSISSEQNSLTRKQGWGEGANKEK